MDWKRKSYFITKMAGKETAIRAGDLLEHDDGVVVVSRGKGGTSERFPIIIKRVEDERVLGINLNTGKRISLGPNTAVAFADGLSYFRSEV